MFEEDAVTLRRGIPPRFVTVVRRHSGRAPTDRDRSGRSPRLVFKPLAICQLAIASWCGELKIHVDVTRVITENIRDTSRDAEL